MRNSTLILAAAIAIGAMAGVSAASAADLAAKAPVVDTSYHWSGWYVGGNAGYGFSSNSTSIYGLDPGGVVRADLFLPPALSENRNGFLGGLQFGVNYQTGNIVAGVEADLDAGRVRGSSQGPPFVVAGPTFITSSTETNLDWFGTVRGRLGVSAFDRSLFYATGGLAYGRATSSFNATHSSGACTSVVNLCLANSAQKWMSGWTLGAGWEYAIAGNWSTKLEYLYYDLGVIDNVLTPLNGTQNITFGTSTRMNGNIVRAGLNYRFSGPVVAKY